MGLDGRVSRDLAGDMFEFDCIIEVERERKGKEEVLGMYLFLSQFITTSCEAEMTNEHLRITRQGYCVPRLERNSLLDERSANSLVRPISRVIWNKSARSSPLTPFFFSLFLDVSQWKTVWRWVIALGEWLQIFSLASIDSPLYLSTKAFYTPRASRWIDRQREREREGGEEYRYRSDLIKGASQSHCVREGERVSIGDSLIGPEIIEMTTSDKIYTSPHRVN